MKQNELSNVVIFPVVPKDAPLPIKRPCDFGLEGAAFDLEIQLGTIEAYNRLVAMARKLKQRIENGDIKAASLQYQTSVRG